MKHYLLFYEAADDYLARRAEFRSEHLDQAWKANERGELVLAGTLVDPTDGAVLLFLSESPDVAKKFAEADPFVRNGLIRRWYVREWRTVVGEDALSPLRAAGPAA